MEFCFVGDLGENERCFFPLKLGRFFMFLLPFQKRKILHEIFNHVSEDMQVFGEVALFFWGWEIYNQAESSEKMLPA